MKKIVLALLFLLGTTVTLAQADKVDDSEEQYLDQLEQFQEPPTQLDLERRTRVEAERKQNEKAEKKREKKSAREKRKQEARKQKAVSIMRSA